MSTDVLPLPPAAPVGAGDNAPPAVSADSQDRNALRKAMDAMPVTSLYPDFVGTADIFFLLSTNTLQEALELYQAKRIHSAPVLDLKRAEVIGMLDLLDIVGFVLDKVQPMDADAVLPPSGSMDEQLLAALSTLTVAGRDLSKLKVSDAFGILLAQRANTVAQRTWSVLQVAEWYLAAGLQRVAVVDGERVVMVVSQSTMLRFVAAHRNVAELRLSRTVREAGLATQQAGHSLVVMQRDARAVDAFCSMRHHGVSALPVVDEEGCLVGNVSISDIRRVGSFAKNLPALLMRLPLFLAFGDEQPAAAAPDEADSAKLGQAPPAATRLSSRPVFVGPDQTLGELLDLLLLHGIHRVWVVDAQRKPVSLITAKDLLQKLIDEE